KDVIAQGVSTPRFNMMLVSAFAAIAVLLSSIGIYGVIAYSVTQRHHEIGVRMALGATPRDVLRLVISDGILIGMIGVGLGLGGALALSRVMLGLLVGISIQDPFTFVAGAAVLLIVTLTATYAPALRAARTEPSRALRV